MSTVAMPANIETWLNRFTDALRDPSPDYVADLFVDDCYWRDMSAFTWDLRTLEGRDQIRHMVASAQRFLKGSWWKAVSSPLTTEDQAVIEFETELGRGTGVVRLRDGRCWTLLTALSELKGHEEASGLRRHSGSPRGVTDPKVNWQDVRNEEARTLGYSAQPYVLIIGGGQGGLALAARLKHLDVPTLIVDRHARTGDQWRSRYHSLLLHDPIWYDHMPYIPFPDTWPVFTPKDKLADWLEAYAKIMELNIWLSTTFRQASYDEGSQTWRIEVDRDGEAVVLRPKHLVIATGNAGWPIVPEFKGADTFRGKILHSSVFTDAEAHKGRRVAVIGSNNSAQDVCADLARGGVDVTMIQRDPTSIVRSDTVIEVMLKGLYSEEAVAAGLTTDLADLANASTPLRLAPDIYRPMTEAVAQKDADYYARLEATGFMHDFGEDGTGMGLKYLRRASGYYIDVGAVDLLISGAIKLRSRVGVDHIEPDGVVLSDGSKVVADDIICATGFGSMDQWVANIISPEVAKKVGKVWGYGSGTTGDPGPWEGEIRNMWKPTKQPGLWFHGGNLAQSRFYSKILALQLKARHAGLPVEVYSPA